MVSIKIPPKRRRKGAPSGHAGARSRSATDASTTDGAAVANAGERKSSVKEPKSRHATRPPELALDKKLSAKVPKSRDATVAKEADKTQLLPLPHKRSPHKVVDSAKKHAPRRLQSNVGKRLGEKKDRPAGLRGSGDAIKAFALREGLPTVDPGKWRKRLVRQLKGQDTLDVLRAEGQSILRQEARHRLALKKFLYLVYACACVLRADEDQRIKFCADPVWANSRAKPRHDRPDEMLRFAFRFSLDGDRRSVNDKSSKYTRALLSAWNAGKTPDEMLLELEEYGVEAASRGQPMKVVGEKPATDIEDLPSTTSSHPDNEVARKGKVLDGEVLPKGRFFEGQKTVRFGESKSSPTHEAILESWRANPGQPLLRFEIRRLK